MTWKCVLPSTIVSTVGCWSCSLLPSCGAELWQLLSQRPHLCPTVQAPERAYQRASACRASWHVVHHLPCLRLASDKGGSHVRYRQACSTGSSSYSGAVCGPR